MKKFFRYGLPVLAAVLCLLGGCTQQRNMDLQEYCRRWNTLTAQTQLSPEQFFKTTEEEGTYYHCMFSPCADAKVLCSLKAQENGTVTAVCLTCLAQDCGDREKALSSLCRAFDRAVCLLQNKTEEKEGKAALQALGFDTEKIGFAAYTVSKADAKYRCTAVCRAEVIALFCERL